ncbi:MAG: heavy metal translocating P-type ATPase [Patescibacteria group bacterium]|nr:heavy metal translocating P-type ATPase [bacterium]MDZ4227343.1 heavy metal translocating P-type ATPase [Patescibacteria group bacterium]
MGYLLRKEFRLPIFVLLCLVVGGVLYASPLGGYVWIVGIVTGVVKIVRDSVGKIRRGEYSLDYIAFLAMVVSLVAEQYLAGAVVALMITGGEALDEYASARAESALRGLAERIPKTCTVKLASGATSAKPIQDVREGEVIVIRPNELIPLDGTLRSNEALLNEANLTGEAIPVSFHRGSFIKSGGVNVGETMMLEVQGTFESSTYMKIVHLVDEAKEHQAPVVRLAERVNFPFTAIALILAGGAYAYSGELWRALAVLVIATPCPLLIAAPVAFIGGLSRAARRNIIVKRPATLEELTRVKLVFFDKTGTLTLGEPRLTAIKPVTAERSETELLAIASAIEFHSIHPLARAILTARAKRGAPMLEATEVVETIGRGISGDVGGARFTVQKAEEADGLVLSLCEGDKEIARMSFADEIKENITELFREFTRHGLETEILTGDKRKNAESIFSDMDVRIRADLSPESKFAIIDEARTRGVVVAMVGDGLNDAPALAEANVGIVFSGTENSAAIDAADAVILGRDVGLISELFETARRSMRVARQSIWGGVALSTIGMVFAAFGFVPPIAGALIQEAIDVVVILNSLRAASSK